MAKLLLLLLQTETLTDLHSCRKSVILFYLHTEILICLTSTEETTSLQSSAMSKVRSNVFFAIVFLYCFNSKCISCENVFGKLLNFAKNNVTKPVINKLFLNIYQNGTVSKFPPIVEFLAQKVQSQFSNFVYEDLSRPPAWDRPIYTLAPDDPLLQELHGNFTINDSHVIVINGTNVLATENSHQEDTLGDDIKPEPLLFEIINDNENITINENLIERETASNSEDEDFDDDNDETEISTPVNLLFEIIHRKSNISTLPNENIEEELSNIISVTNGSLDYSNNVLHGHTQYQTIIIVSDVSRDNE